MTYQARITRGAEPQPKGRYIEFNGVLSTDPFAALDALGQHPPFWVDDPNDVDGYWVATRFEDVRDILQDAETFSSIDSQIPFVQMAEPLLPTETDPPVTQKLRAVLMPLLTAKRIGALEHRMHEVARGIIEGFRGEGGCDVIERFSRVYPITIFLEFFGLPASRRVEFQRQAARFQHGTDERIEAWNGIRAIIAEQLELKRGRPGDDVLSAIANGRIDREPLDQKTAISVAATVFVGGLDTLPSVIGWSLRFLSQNPEYRRQIIEQPELIPGAAEEFLRLYSVANPMRRVRKTLEFRGANFVEGDRILCSTAAAGRDVAVFGDKADFGRKVNPHIAFATGPHRCLGSHLARHELAVALKVWHDLIPDYRVDPNVPVHYVGPVFAMDNLPLVWDA
jgi:cytochrome P450